LPTQFGEPQQRFAVLFLGPGDPPELSLRASPFQNIPIYGHVFAMKVAPATQALSAFA
jgi:hypothetical protein